jgi:hypothetical protein
MDGIWIVYLVLAAFPGLIVFAAIYKYIEVSEAARWPSAPGKVVVSKSETRQVKTGVNSSEAETRNFAKIVYEYTVAGRKHRCDRVSIGENLGNFEVAETIARYPVGTAVTVYYKPTEPSKAVIERDVPPGMWKGVVILVLVMIGIILVAIFGFGALGDVVSVFARDPRKAPFVAACVGFALLAALVIYAIQRHVARMTKWPTVPGRIEFSGVRQFEKLDDDGGRSRTWHRADVQYSYDVNGVRYTGDKTGTTGRASTTTPWVLGRGAPYAAGDAVDIHYNPENPTESILNPRLGPLWWLWIVPIGVLALAYAIAQ